MRKIGSIVLAALILLSLVAMLPLYVSAAESSTHLIVFEWYGSGHITLNAIPFPDDSESNPDYKLLSFHWYTTAEYWINPENGYGFSDDEVVNAITAAADTWDSQTGFPVFSYEGIIYRVAGVKDGLNVVSWGKYSQSNAIAVTFIWYTRTRVGRSIRMEIVETDTLLNIYYSWSLSGEDDKMDVQNIMTHEFGHWCGLDDLYKDRDYWLTMYGYASVGETHKQTLGYGDILGLQKVYGK
jgi:hypothetical protein